MREATVTKLVYQGPHDAVVIDATGTVAERDRPVEVPADVAQALLEQSTWRKATKTADDAVKEDS